MALASRLLSPNTVSATCCSLGTLILHSRKIILVEPADLFCIAAIICAFIFGLLAQLRRRASSSFLSSAAKREAIARVRSSMSPDFGASRRPLPGSPPSLYSKPDSLVQRLSTGHLRLTGSENEHCKRQCWDDNPIYIHPVSPLCHPSRHFGLGEPPSAVPKYYQRLTQSWGGEGSSGSSSHGSSTGGTGAPAFWNSPVTAVFDLPFSSCPGATKRALSGL